MVGKPAPFFPMIGKIFPMVGKLCPIFPTIGKIFRRFPMIGKTFREVTKGTKDTRMVGGKRKTNRTKEDKIAGGTAGGGKLLECLECRFADSEGLGGGRNLH